MPIEDVGHLLKNSVQESALLFIDSSRRDRGKYPTPSEYVVQLDEPIPNVYGIDVLDASIPSTMYNVDAHNNSLRIIEVDVAQSGAFISSSGSSIDEQERQQLRVLNDEMFAMGYASPLRMNWLPDPEGSEYVVVVGEWEDAQPPLALAGYSPETTMVAATDADGVDDAHRYRVLRKRRFGPFPVLRGSRSPDVVVGDIAYTISTSPDGPYASEADRARAALALEPQPRVAMVPYDAVAQLYTMVAYDTYALPDAGAFEAVASELTSARRFLRFRVATASIETGNYTGITALQIAFQSALDAANIGVRVGSTTGVVEKQAKFRLTSDAGTRVLLSTAESTARMTIGFDLDASMDANAKPRAGRGYAAVTAGGQAAPMYTGVMQDDGSFRLDTPGIIALTGMRYITLRCPEIEQHVGAIGKYGPYSAGIGVFKLLNPNEVAQLRFDYINLVRKPFHPIARLTRLRLRFELPDNVLYDFKGVNHQILVTVKYYTPVPMPSSSSSMPSATEDPFPYVLNPDYDPNFMNFIARRTGYADRLDAPGFDPNDEDYTTDDDDSDEEN
jgi:hypothetical protein